MITLAACVDQRGGSHCKPGLYSSTRRHCQSLYTGLGAPILSLHVGDALDLSELEHFALRCDPKCKETLMLVTRHKRTLKLVATLCLASCCIWMVVILAAEISV